MKPDKDEARLRHMRDASREAIEMGFGRNREDLDRDRMLNLALVRLVEIIGEASSRISPERRARHGEVDWPRIVGMRNRLIHGYDTIDFDILWATLNDDLPPLVAALDKLIGDPS